MQDLERAGRGPSLSSGSPLPWVTARDGAGVGELPSMGY